MSRVESTLLIPPMPASVNVVTTIVCSQVTVFQQSGWHVPFSVVDGGVTKQIRTDGRYTFKGSFAAGVTMGTLSALGAASNPSQNAATVTGIGNVAAFVLVEE